jgi:hypothetical protein
LYHVPRSRFDYTLLDAEDPFEIDLGNRPHLYKHLPTDGAGRYIAVGLEDIREAYQDGDPTFYEADEGGSADWLMLASLRGLSSVFRWLLRTLVMRRSAGRSAYIKRTLRTAKNI